MPELGKATYVVEIDSRDFDRKIKEIDKKTAASARKQDSELSDVAKSWDKVTLNVTKTSETIDENTRHVDKNRKSFKDFGSDLVRVNQALSLFGKVVGAAKIPAFTALIGYAVKAVSALAAGSFALVGALAPLSGILVAYPALLGAVGQAMITLKIAGVEKLTQALGGNKKALEELTPQARHLVHTLREMKPQWENLRKQVQAPLFEGVERGIKKAHRNFSVFRTVMVATGGSLGFVAEQAGKLFGSKGFGGRFEKIGLMNARTIRVMGTAALSLFDALSHVMVAARPFINWLTDGVQHFGEWADQAAAAGQKTGKMTKFFAQTKEVMTTLWHTFRDLGIALFDIGKQGVPLGREMLHVFEQSAKHFREWTESASGQNKIAKWFREAKQPLWEMGRLLHDLTLDLFSLGEAKGLSPFIRALRMEVLPELTSFFKETTNSFGPTLIKAMVALIRLARIFIGTSGPLQVAVTLVTKLAEAITWIAKEIPGAKTVMVTLVGAAAIFKGVKFVGWITGLKGVIGLLEKAAIKMGILSAASGGAGVTGTAASTVAGGAAAGAGGGLGAKILSKLPGGAALAGATRPMLLGTGAVVISSIIVGGVEHKIKTGSDFGDTLKNIITAGPDTLLKPQHIGPLKLPGIERLWSGGDDKEPHELLHKVNRRKMSKGLLPQFSVGELKHNVDAFKKSLTEMRGSAVWGLGGINAEFRKSAGILAKTFAPGSWPMRKNMAKAMHGSIAEIKQGMAAGLIPARQGKKQINRILEEIHITKGKDSLGIAKGTLESFKSAGGILPGQVNSWLKKLDRMPEGARERGIDAINKMVKAWSSGRPRLEKQFSLLVQVEKQRFGSTNKQIQKSTANAMSHVALSAQSGANAMATALGNIGTNLTSALSALGAVKVPKFQVDYMKQHGSFGVGAATGYLPGQGLQDKVPIMAAPGEAVVNRHQQKPIDFALMNTFGFGLPGLFNRVRTPHYMAEGGIVRQVLHGGGAMRPGEQKGVDMVWRAAVKYFEAHNGKGKVIANGSRMDALRQPYLWGGGHGPTPSRMGPWDCSGGISEMLAGTGLKGSSFNFAPMVSGGFESWGKPGRGDVTVLANAEHVYSVISGKGAIGTSDSNPGGGFGWISDYTFRPGFVERHADFGAMSSRVGGPRGGGRGKGDKKVKGMAKGGKIGPGGPRFNHAINDIWNRAGSSYGRSKKAHAPFTFLGRTPGNNGETFTMRGGKAVIINSKLADSIVDEHGEGMRTLLHEWAHVFQDKREHMKKWESEGGAAGFAQWAGPKLFGPGPWAPNTREYRKYLHSVLAHKGWGWIKRGQFHAGLKAPGYAKGGFVRAARGKGPWAGTSIDRTYAKMDPNTESGPTLKPYVIAALAEWAGLPGITMAQITKGESTGHPGMDISDPPGRGRGLYAINSVTSGNNQSSSELRNPILNTLAAADLAHAAGGPNSSIWHGDTFVTGWNLHYDNDPAKIARSLGGHGGGGSAPHEKVPKGIQITVPPHIPGWGTTHQEWVSTEQIEIPGTMPKTVEGCVKEIALRRYQLRKQKRALTKAKSAGARANLSGNVKKLEDRIKALQNERKKLIAQAKRRRWVEHTVGAKYMAGFSERLEKAQARVALARQSAERFAVFEPAEEGSGLQQYRGEEAGKWGEVLDAVLGVAELERHGAGFAEGHISGTEHEIAKAKRKGQRAKLKGLKGGLGTAREFLKSRGEDLDGIQGLGGPRAPWRPLGSIAPGSVNWLTLGGPGSEIFDTQNLIRELTLPVGGGSDASNENASAEVEKALREAAERRANVSEALAPVFSDFFAHVPRYGGSFHSGGIVPGRAGEERTIIAQGGEIIAQPGTTNSGGISELPQPVLIIEDGAIDQSKIRHVWRDEARRQVSESRRRIGG